MALNRHILLVSFTPTHEKHNARIGRLLQNSFEVSQISFVDPHSTLVSKIPWRRVTSNFANMISIPLISLLVLTLQILTLDFRRKNTTQILVKLIDAYFLGEKGIRVGILHLNRTLRSQKYKIEVSRKVTKEATEKRIACVLLPEDNNYYGTGILISGLLENEIDVGVVEFTSGKASEFAQSQAFFTSEMQTRKYQIFSKLFLTSTALSRWQECRNFMSCFPGSLEIPSLSHLRPAVQSGMAKFYLGTSQTDIDDLRIVVDPNTELCLIEPIEFTLADVPAVKSQRDIFAVFLPPDQFSDLAVKKRLAKSDVTSYRDMIRKIVSQSFNVCGESNQLVFFPHPRMYISNLDLIEEITRKYRVVSDFSTDLMKIRCAVIFSSAVFSALLAAEVRVFNLDIYSYNYEGVFPTSNENFIEISSLDDIKNINLDFSRRSQKDVSGLIKITEFLESRL